MEKVSPETLRRRRSCVRLTILQNFGENGVNIFIADAIRQKGKDERKQLLKDMGLAGEMTTEEGLAMFVDIKTTWTTMRKLRR